MLDFVVLVWPIPGRNLSEAFELPVKFEVEEFELESQSIHLHIISTGWIKRLTMSKPHGQMMLYSGQDVLFL